MFIYTHNIYMQDRESVFTKKVKTFTSFVLIEVFCVKSRNISKKINIWITFSIDIIIILCKKVI